MVPVAGAGSVVIVLQGPVIVVQKVKVVPGWIADVERSSGDATAGGTATGAVIGTGTATAATDATGQGRFVSAARVRSRSAVPDRRVCQWPTLAIRPLLTRSRFLRGGAMNPFEVWGA